MRNIEAILSEISSEGFAAELSLASTVQTFIRIVERNPMASELAELLKSDTENLSFTCNFALRTVTERDHRRTILFPDLTVGALLCVLRNFLSNDVDEVFSKIVSTNVQDFVWAPILANSLRPELTRDISTYEELSPEIEVSQIDYQVLRQISFAVIETEEQEGQEHIPIKPVENSISADGRSSLYGQA